MVYVVKNAADFAAKLEEAGDKLVVVDFYATWCGPCKAIAPKLDELAAKYTDTVVFLKVDVDENEDIAAEQNIASMPTFVYFKNSTRVADFSGANATKLEELINTHTG